MELFKIVFSLVLCSLFFSTVAGEPTCDSHPCKDDEICIIDKVYCKKAPCPLQPTCIPNPCLKKACNRGEVCKLQEVQCFTIPCPPIAICVKDCPQIKCDIYCEYGYKLDKNGCQTCNCAPNPCLTYKCPSGKYCDIERIFCLVAPCPPPRPICIDPCASVSCPVGSKCVSHNVTCVKAPCPPQPECVEQDCPKYKCKPCEFGYATDENNCQTCNCLPNPCSTILCPIGEVCTLKDDTDCNTYPCPKLPVCVPVCPALKCKTCLYGNVIDKNGCETCQCKDPCADISCKNGEACGLVTVACITQPCPPQPRCVPIDEQYCHFGNPLTIRVHNQDEFVPCNNCPESYECKEGIVGKPVVCCLKSNPTGCPLLNCVKNCEFGYTFDSKGCRTCTCVDPCTSIGCPVGEECVVRKYGNKPSSLKCVREIYCD